jgi:two-component system sensor histidine kinase ChiS
MLKQKIHILFSTLVYILTGTLLSSTLYAQEYELKFKHFTIDDGLSQSRVSCFLQDCRGFMWIGTHEGLNKYDGYDFTVCIKDPNSPGTISGNIIRCIYEDSKNNLWIGTASNGLNLYDRSSNRFIHFTQDSTSKIQISNNEVNSIMEDKQGKLWLGTGQGIDLIDWDNQKVINFLPDHLADYPSNKNNVKTLFEDKQSEFWVGSSGGGLYRFDREEKTFERFQYDPGNKRSISDNFVTSIYEDTEGNLWIGTYNGGLNLFDKEKKLFFRFYPDPEEKGSFTIKAILDDDHGNLWLGTRDGLYLFNKKTHNFLRYAHEPHNLSGLSQNNVQAIFKDFKGDFWFGTKGGINFLNTTTTPFAHYKADIDHKGYLNHGKVLSIMEDSSGEFWFGTEEGGLNRLNRKSGNYTYYLHNPNSPNTISSNQVTAIAEDRDGNIWIGTFQGGVNLFNRKTNKFKRIKINPNDPLINQNTINSLYVDRDGDIWIGSSKLFRFNKEEEAIVPIPLNISGIYPNIYAITEDSAGKIWCGSQDGKIYCIDKSTLAHETYHIYKGGEIAHINIIMEDREQNLWIGTLAGGLYFFDKKLKTHKNYTTIDGLASNSVNAILQDDQGNLWISTTNGLSNFNPETKTFKNYYKENGLQGNLFTRGYYKTRSGEMFFGGVNGITAFHPGNIISNSFVPPVVITDFKIFNKSVEIGGKNSILNEHISETKRIELSYKDAVFTFTFAALNFAISAQNQFAYIMEGFETEWNYVDSKQRFATYTNLDPGTYIFKVKAANNDGLWNEKGTRIEVLITPPFWGTWWFKIILIAIIALIIWHFFNYLTQKRNLLRATALANLSQLKLLRNQMNPHFLFNALGSIRSLININKEKAWQLVSELAEFFQYTLLNYDKLEATLDEEIEAANNYIYIEKIQYEEPLKVSFEVDEAARACTVPAFILQPLIENAIKHGLNENPDQFEIRIKITFDAGILAIDISNTGKLKNLVEDDSKVSEAHGTSLRNIRKRLQLLFNNEFSFQLFEEEGWVHVKIKINFEKSKQVMTSITEEV